MSIFSGKKQIKKKRALLTKEAETFIQVHYVRDRQSQNYLYNALKLKDDPDRDACNEWYIINGNPETYPAIILRYLDDKRTSIETLTSKTGMDSNYIDNLKNDTNYVPAKGEAVAACLACKLNFEEARVLLEKSGYQLTNSSKEDLIVRYFLLNKLYSTSDLNYVLEAICNVKLKDL